MIKRTLVSTGWIINHEFYQLCKYLIINQISTIFQRFTILASNVMNINNIFGGRRFFFEKIEKLISFHPRQIIGDSISTKFVETFHFFGVTCTYIFTCLFSNLILHKILYIDPQSISYPQLTKRSQQVRNNKEKKDYFISTFG